MAIMGMFAKGFDAVMASLRNVGQKVPETGRKTMHRGADKIELMAKLQCPRDTQALENSIRQEVQYEERGRLAIDIVCGGMSGGIDTTVYAALIHENYESVIAKNGPGRNTLAKMRDNPGVLIGSKFLTRAVDDQRDKLGLAIIEACIITAKEELNK